MNQNLLNPGTFHVRSGEIRNIPFSQLREWVYKSPLLFEGTSGINTVAYIYSGLTTCTAKTLFAES